MGLISITIFSLMTLSSSLAVASHHITKDDVDLLIARSRSSPFLDLMLDAKDDFFSTSSGDTKELLDRCRDLTDSLICSFTNQPVDKPGHEFYRSDAVFRTVMGDTWPSTRFAHNPLFKKAWSAYYLEAGNYSIEIGEPDNALPLFLEADAIVENSAIYFIDRMINDRSDRLEEFKARKDVDEFAKQSARREHQEIVTNFIAVCKRVKEQQGVSPNAEFNRMMTLHCDKISDHPRTVKYVRRYFAALNKEGGGRESKYMNSIIVAMIFAHIETGRLEGAKTFLREFSTMNFVGTDSLWAHVYAREGNWDAAFEHLSKAEADIILKGCDDETLLPIITMLSKVSPAQFNGAGIRILLKIKRNFPSFSRSIDSVVRDKKKETRHLKLVTAIKTDLVDKIYERASSSYHAADGAYQKIWRQSSRLMDADGDFWHMIDEQAQALKHAFEVIRDLTLSENTDDVYEQIKDGTNDFEIMVESFLRAIKTAEQQLKEKRRAEISRDSSFQNDCGDHSYVVVTQENLRNQYSRERETALHASSPQMAHKKQQGTAASSNTACLKRDGFVAAFKDRQIAKLWKEDNLPSAALEILDCLQSATSIYEFRQNFTKPGAKLEVLKGNRAGQLSVRTNGQYRVCFNWTTGKGASAIEIVDYHK